MKTSFLVRLSGSYPELSLFEAVSLISKEFKLPLKNIKSKKTNLLGIITIEKSIPKTKSSIKKISDKAALINGIGFLEDKASSPKQISLTLKVSTFSISFDSINKKDYSSKDIIKILAAKIKQSNPKSKVSLSSPKFPITVVSQDKKLYTTIYYQKISKSEFEKRKSSKRPFNYPVTLKPKLAQGILNILYSLSKSPTPKVLDLFTGTGTFVQESHFSKLKNAKKSKFIAADASLKMLEGTEKNLSKLKVKNYILINSVAPEIPSKPNSLNIAILDFPFGKGSKIYSDKSYNSFVNQTLKNLYPKLKKSSIVAVVLPLNSRPITKLKKLLKTSFMENKDLGRKVLILKKA